MRSVSIGFSLLSSLPSSQSQCQIWDHDKATQNLEVYCEYLLLLLILIWDFHTSSLHQVGTYSTSQKLFFVVIVVSMAQAKSLFFNIWWDLNQTGFERWVCVLWKGSFPSAVALCDALSDLAEVVAGHGPLRHVVPVHLEHVVAAMGDERRIGHGHALVTEGDDRVSLWGRGDEQISSKSSRKHYFHRFNLCREVVLTRWEPRLLRGISGGGSEVVEAVVFFSKSFLHTWAMIPAAKASPRTLIIVRKRSLRVRWGGKQIH